MSRINCVKKCFIKYNKIIYYRNFICFCTILKINKNVDWEDRVTMYKYNYII